MEAGEEPQAADIGLPEPEAAAPKPEAKEEPKPLSPSSPEANPLPPPPTPHPTSPGDPKETEAQEPETSLEEETSSSWSGPDELEQVLQDGQKCVRARRSLAEGLLWGPFRGSIQNRASSPGQTEPSLALTLLLEDEACWLRTLPQALTEAEANVEIHRKDGALWCRLTKPVPAGGLLSVFLVAEPHSTPSHPVKKEPTEPECLAPSHTDIQLLPQQAGMASILATAVINKDVFPCKDCGIWYRSERNLQAHLLYYCASRQSASSPATAAADEKPKEPYPNERVCPFPQCRKSCPSASSLEIHMRSHSGERPFVCLICLSAFTTKANCERHLKVHTDTQSGVCHSCGFISTTRDILYSHLVTNHMVCQPGSKAEIYSPGVGHPSAKLPPGLAQAGPAPALKCGPWGLPADSLAGFQQHTALHGPLASSDLGLGSAPSPGLDRKALAEATNGEAGTASQNGGSSEPPVAPRSIKVEAPEDQEVELGPPAPTSRTPSPPSSAPARVKAEPPSPTPGSSPGPGALFLPQFPAAPPASEILAKMSELVHSRLQLGSGNGPDPSDGPIDLSKKPRRQAPATPLPSPTPVLPALADYHECTACRVSFHSLEAYLAHKKFSCPAAPRRPRAPEDPAVVCPYCPLNGLVRGDLVEHLRLAHGRLLGKPLTGPGQGAEARTPSPAAPRDGLNGQEPPTVPPDSSPRPGPPSAPPTPPSHSDKGVQTPSKGTPTSLPNGNHRFCRLCNIKFSSLSTFIAHKKYYCSSHASEHVK
ncbi:PREDICTED: zinc finger protein ZFPM1 [Miniopterus natalensis]|uniref:zinc finger protein ZFPM1 n=1 Tax=Miniopterus natalensis TaxID=291302 RepID=UPI0007A6CA2F|nr:PREDICTED: zinc finger protein ZFPM1 [Miniopterus natalensis]